MKKIIDGNGFVECSLFLGKEEFRIENEIKGKGMMKTWFLER